MYSFDIEDLFTAYYDARTNKRNTISQLKFEMDLEANIVSLYNEICTGRYKVGRSICFIINDPVKREVFAANFRDRVVHHLVYNYIAPILDKSFIYDSYSCRKGKGTLFGIKRLEYHMRSCSDNYTEDCYVLKLDISGYFMNINRLLLYDLLEKKLLKESRKGGGSDGSNGSFCRNIGMILWLCKEIILNDPTENCLIKGGEG